MYTPLDYIELKGELTPPGRTLPPKLKIAISCLLTTRSRNVQLPALYGTLNFN